MDLWVTTYRERLMDLSWFMRVLNEPIARQANAEDGVTGRFWEGRFKSQALLDEQAILTAMAYVDLNPIRAKMADTPEASDYTSVAERIAGLREKPEDAETRPEDRAPLMPFDATGRLATAIPFAFDDYLELVDATGRVIREDKRGFIPGHTPRLLEHLAIDPEQFIASVPPGHPLSFIARGRERYVVMDIAHYHDLRECELEAALAETRSDLAAGRAVRESPEAHLTRLDSRE